MSWKYRILIPVILLSLLFAAKYILWDFPISSGKRVGNLSKISKKGKISFFQTWEGTIDEGSGNKLTTQFSVSSESIGEALYAYEGRQVILYYEQYILGWPRDTNYDVVDWKAREDADGFIGIQNSMNKNSHNVIEYMGKTLFCTMLGTLYQDQDLYQKVKEHLKLKNIYLYKQIDKCNE